MKIASKIKPRAKTTRTVTVHGRPYVFAATEDKFGDTHYVAEVKNEDHAAVLLGTDDFYAYRADMVPKAALQPPPAGTTAAPAPAAALDAQFSQDILDEATKLIDGTGTHISAAVGKVSGLVVVRAALALEQAKESPRKGVCTLLETTLAGAAAAGVTG